MGARASLHLSRKALRGVLSSPAVEAVLVAHANQIKAGADAEYVRVGDFRGNRRIPIPIVVTSKSGSFGARAMVTLAHPAGLAVEAKYRLLGRHA